MVALLSRRTKLKVFRRPSFLVAVSIGLLVFLCWLSLQRTGKVASTTRRRRTVVRRQGPSGWGFGDYFRASYDTIGLALLLDADVRILGDHQSTHGYNNSLYWSPEVRVFEEPVNATVCRFEDKMPLKYLNSAIEAYCRGSEKETARWRARMEKAFGHCDVIEHHSWMNFNFWPLKCLADEFKKLSISGALGPCVTKPGTAIAHLRWGDLAGREVHHNKVDFIPNVAKFVSAYNAKNQDAGVTILMEGYHSNQLEGAVGNHTIFSGGSVWETLKTMCEAETLYSAGSGLAMTARVLGNHKAVIAPPGYLRYSGMRLTDYEDYIDVNEYAEGTDHFDMPSVEMSWAS